MSNIYFFLLFARQGAAQTGPMFPAGPAVAARTSSIADNFADAVVSTLALSQQLLAGLLVRLCKHAIKPGRFTPFLRLIETGGCAAAAASLEQRHAWSQPPV